MTRDEALEQLSNSAIGEEEAQREFEYIATKLGITTEDLKGYLNAPNKTHADYKNREAFFVSGAHVMKKLGLEVAVKR